MTDPAMHRLEVRRVVHASVVRVFEAWTEPRHLRIWWGPRDVRCLDASVDLRVGGTYRIVNGMSDGAQVTIFGEFRVVEPPTRLVYTWRSGPDSPASELVTVTFRPLGRDTEVTVIHDFISGPALRDGHMKGWIGCIEGLNRYLAGSDLEWTRDAPSPAVEGSPPPAGPLVHKRKRDKP